MILTKNSFLYVLLLVAISLFPSETHAQYTSEINANRPSNSMGAFSVGKTVFQLETGFFYQDHLDNDNLKNQYGSALQFRYGAFLENIELLADLRYAYTNYSIDSNLKATNELSKLVLGAKYLLYDPFKNYEEKINVYSWKANNRFKWRRLIPIVSFYVGADFQTTTNQAFPDDSEISPKAVLITQQHFSDKWALITNLIGNKLSLEEQRNFEYIVTLTHGFNSKWSAFIENQAIVNSPYKEFNIKTGIATLVHKNLQLDLSAGYQRASKKESYGGQLGLSWRFDKHHIPVEL